MAAPSLDEICRTVAKTRASVFRDDQRRWGATLDGEVEQLVRELIDITREKDGIEIDAADARRLYRRYLEQELANAQDS